MDGPAAVSSGHGTSPGLRPGDGPRLRQAAGDFEALLVGQLLKAMRASLPSSGLFPASGGRKIYEALMDEALARAVVQGRSLGLADLLVRELEKSSSPAAGAPMNAGKPDRPSEGGRR